MGIRVVQSLPEEIWRKFVEDHPVGNIFHTPEMFRVFSGAKGYTPELWATVNSSGQILTLFSTVRVTTVGGFLRDISTRSIAYGDLIPPISSETRDGLEILLQGYLQHCRGVIFTEIRHLNPSEGYRYLLERCGFTRQDYLNFLVNLNLPVEAVWNNIQKSTRKRIHSAAKNGTLQIEELTDPVRLPEWFRILRMSFRRANIPLADYSLFQSAMEILLPRQMIQFLIGSVDGKAVAASAALLYKKKIYGWYRGFDRAFSRLSPNDQMVWHLLKWGAENGFHEFDFGGAGKFGEKYGPREFKAKFGGALVSYGRSRYVHSQTRLLISKLGYQIFRKVI